MPEGGGAGGGGGGGGGGGRTSTGVVASLASRAFLLRKGRGEHARLFPFSRG